MIQELRHSIQHLSESEAKTILLKTMIQLKQIQEFDEAAEQKIEHVNAQSALQLGEMESRNLQKFSLEC